MRERVWFAVPLGQLARMHGVSPAALRRRVQLRARAARDPRVVEFDGHRFRKRDARWYPSTCEPWHSNGRLRAWLSLEDAAARCRMKPAALRRQMQRRAHRDAGLFLASWRGLLGCKFGDTWRVCLEDDTGATNV